MAVPIRPALAYGKTRLLTGIRRRPWTLDLARSVVTITFDDVPATAVERGLPILDEFGVPATFYVCSDLGQLEDGRPTIDLDTVAALSAAGHEIGCHTASHLNLRQQSLEAALEDCRRNRLALADATDGRWPRNFSYPFGAVTLKSKLPLAQHYASLRSTRPGVHRGRFDLSCLYGVEFYEGSFDEATFAHMLDSLEDQPGWLVVYTHGIDHYPAMDATSSMLEWLLQQLVDRGIDTATIDHVLRAQGVAEGPGDQTGLAAA